MLGMRNPSFIGHRYLLLTHLQIPTEVEGKMPSKTWKPRFLVRGQITRSGY